MRVVAVYLIALALLFPISTFLYGNVALGIIWAAALGLFALYIAFRSGYFARTVMLQIPGNQRPTPEKIRNTQGGIRFPEWDDATYLHVEDANEQISPDERVIGFEINGDAAAYPLSAMVFREVANEAIESLPISVTWSPVTYSPRVFVTRGPNGEAFTLSPTAKTLLNSPLYESENGSWYMQFTGEAIAGPDAGHRLEHLPSVNTTWRAWTTAWPESEAMSKTATPENDVFENYYASTRPGLYPQSTSDKRLPNKDVVLGVFTSERDAKCYSAHSLRQNPLIHDHIGSTPILALCERSSSTYIAFDRRVRGRTLTFTGHSKNLHRPNRVVESKDEVEGAEESDTPYEAWILLDEETDSAWHAVSGLCMEGEMKGERLTKLDGRLSFWFAWSKLHADVELVL